MTKIRHLIDAVLTSPGEAAPPLRRAVEARAAELGGRSSTATGDVPLVLSGYVDKVARHAYKVTDEDIAALRQAGYSEDEIFEITVSAALGASMARMERGMAALKGGQ
jgi:alkylhydroperoxidase family enzyme